MSTKPTISMIVPALNEEEHLEETVDTILRATADRVEFFEIIIVDDGSTDRTGALADRLAQQNGCIRVVHNPRSMGLGHAYGTGVALSSYEYVIMVPADNETPVETIRVIIDNSRNCDSVLTYVINPQVRPLSRRLLSRLFVWVVNAITGLRLRYYNGNCSIRREILRRIPMEVNGHAYMAAILVRLFMRGSTHREIGVWLEPRLSGRSKAFKIRNILSVSKTLASLFWETRITNRRRRPKLIALPPSDADPESKKKS